MFEIIGDRLKAMIRTVWPAVVATLAALVATQLGEHLGIKVDSVQVFGLVSLVLLAVIYGLGGWLERQTSPPLRTVGRWLISVGMDLGTPAYAKPADTTATRRGPPDA